MRWDIIRVIGDRRVALAHNEITDAIARMHGYGSIRRKVFCRRGRLESHISSLLRRGLIAKTSIPKEDHAAQAMTPVEGFILTETGQWAHEKVVAGRTSEIW
ncbi:MAG: hypothetical protein A3B10_01035 [Candidatus Doudnabacteria bacterium RIFCSPLOWO2_01_FULL_44_21]|uniref:Uncharacterized protein n=1 Tax=Candidatus Doudnabacteria bacterium RIFCSPLOWO2_01_FULL_44_21 TaxID=1817841 RepID=A0A1F5PWS8_9BACT|nr:MAG: hypothetical protein A3B95_03945 [Candidatus Doudnabacteria bacterium RIFCSPHIGHO2_02_FULL_43_13b]OGE94375.1 MAG: hypothetical protein A3B10_01035 [Candidatus Doudnabacteria bacterium RIFCSPLOWO2_01_FULL_44_21]